MNFFDMFLRKNSFLNKLVLIDESNGSVTVDLLVHERLGESRLIDFVMSVLSVSDDVDNNIIAKLLSILSSNLASLDNILNRVTVHVNDRGITSLTKISGVEARP